MSCILQDWDTPSSYVGPVGPPFQFNFDDPLNFKIQMQLGRSRFRPLRPNGENFALRSFPLNSMTKGGHVL